MQVMAIRKLVKVLTRRARCAIRHCRKDRANAVGFHTVKVDLTFLPSHSTGQADLLQSGVNAGSHVFVTQRIGVDFVCT